MTSRRPERPRCPRCGSSEVIPVRYGYPSPAAEAEAERGECELAGCVVPAVPDDWCCRACAHRWPEADGDLP